MQMSQLQSLRMEQRQTMPSHAVMMLSQSLEQTLYTIQHLSEENIDGLENTAGKYPDEQKKNGGYAWTQEFSDLRDYSESCLPAGAGRSDVVFDFVDGELKATINPEIEWDIRAAQKMLTELTKGKGGNRERDRYLTYSLKRHYDFVSKILPQIVQYVFERQRDYLESGRIEDFQPIAYVELAEHFELDPSTVLRMVKNKTIDAPNGMKVSLDDLIIPNVTVNKIKGIKLVRDITREVFYENDDELARILAERGHPCQRRTAAKYRALAEKYRKGFFVESSAASA